MAVEIERKFLLRTEEWRNYIQASNALQQGYILYGDDRNLRIRIKNGNAARLTIKIGSSSLVRSEYEYDVPLNDAFEMLDQAQGIVIEKTRHLVHWDNHMWEIDEFSGAYLGLITAEVELESTEEVPTMPEWIGEEVTSDRRYSNQTLATEDMRSALGIA
jgi:adenylate cyclase